MSSSLRPVLDGKAGGAAAVFCVGAGGSGWMASTGAGAGGTGDASTGGGSTGDGGTGGGDWNAKMATSRRLMHRLEPGSRMLTTRAMELHAFVKGPPLSCNDVGIVPSQHFSTSISSSLAVPFPIQIS